MLATVLVLLGLGGWYRYHQDQIQAQLRKAADDHAFETALAKNTEAAYRGYLSGCPADGCGHRPQAEQRLRDLTAEALAEAERVAREHAAQERARQEAERQAAAEREARDRAEQERTQREPAQPQAAADRTPDAPAKPQPLTPTRAAAAWKACSEAVYKKLVAKGEREHGDSAYYTGAGGAGANLDIQKKCGYKPMTRQGCDDAYIHTYLSCRNRTWDPQDGLSMVEYRWIAKFDPKIFDERRMESLCSAATMLSRAEFGALMCGE